MAQYPGVVYTPRTKENKAGEVYDADKKTIGYAEDITKLDDEIVAIENDILNSTKIRVYRDSSYQSIPSGVVTKVLFNAENYDSEDEFDISVGHDFTVKKDGYYQVMLSLLWQTSVDQTIHYVYVKKNGGNVAISNVVVSGATNPNNHFADVLYFEENDVIDVHCYQASGGAIGLTYGSFRTYMSIRKLLG